MAFAYHYLSAACEAVIDCKRRKYGKSAKKAYDIASLEKDIAERKHIIDKFRQTGMIDRNDAVQKIQELRLKDKEVLKATVAAFAISSTPFCNVNNESIIAELEMQITILSKELTERLEDKNEQ